MKHSFTFHQYDNYAKTINVPFFYFMFSSVFVRWSLFIAKSQFHDKLRVISMLAGIRVWQMQEGDCSNNIVLTTYLLTKYKCYFNYLIKDIIIICIFQNREKQFFVRYNNDGFCSQHNENISNGTYNLSSQINRKELSEEKEYKVNLCFGAVTLPMSGV